jgi:hypothetical protein
MMLLRFALLFVALFGACQLGESVMTAHAGCEAQCGAART